MRKLIALENPPAGRRYGEEFEMSEGSDLTELLLAGRVRIDDRMGDPPSLRAARAVAANPELARAEWNLAPTGAEGGE